MLFLIRAATPAGALAVALAVAPFVAVLQSKALAPITTVALLAAVALHYWRERRWPWPSGGVLWAALALFGWAAISASWALEPRRALFTAVQLGAYVALGAAACRAVAADTAEARQRMLLAGAAGLAAGLLAAGLDMASGHALRLGVRGLTERPGIEFGLKPAASAMALLLPLTAAIPGLPGWMRLLGMLAGGAIVISLPGEAAKVAVLAAGLVGLLFHLAPRALLRGPGPALALLLRAMPLLLGPGLARGVPAGHLPVSAAHRLVIWDFAIERIAERPVLGWGMEASRRIPGGGDPPSEARLARFGLSGPPNHDILAAATLLPLHTHNGPLQIWLELGLVGALLTALLAVLLGRALARTARPGIAAAMLASAAITGLVSFGVWQEWWVSAQLLALASLAALPRPEK